MSNSLLRIGQENYQRGHHRPIVRTKSGYIHQNIFAPREMDDKFDGSYWMHHGSPLKCYSDTGTWWRYIDCDTVKGYLSCYTRYDVDRRLELSRGCSTHQLQEKQHECETQTSRDLREIVCYCSYNYCNSGFIYILC